MNISDVKHSIKAHKKRKRVGRGDASGNGKTCGKGHKGQKSRSGYSSRSVYEGGQMPLFRRLPKRGFNNANFKKDWTLVNTFQLNVFDDGDTVTPETLLEKGVISKLRDGVKVLGSGDINNKLTVQAHAFSKSAREKIQNAGGEAVEIKKVKKTDKEKAAPETK